MANHLEFLLILLVVDGGVKLFLDPQKGLLVLKKIEQTF